jgi:hypothetical protein
VISGVGITQCWGKPVAIQESLDGRVVDWLEKVTETEYQAAAAIAE